MREMKACIKNNALYERYFFCSEKTFFSFGEKIFSPKVLEDSTGDAKVQYREDFKAFYQVNI